MKILQTSDWHLGKRLHQVDLTEDHKRFFDWFLEKIKKEAIDVVLVSGDVFDLANPSSEARKLYYEVLLELSRRHCTVILTGGNHDSPSVLNAPKEILKALNIHVIGGLPEELKDLVIPLTDRNGEQRAVVAAIPYLRDTDLRKASPGSSYEDRVEEVQLGITKIFREAAEICQANYPDLPALAMGHLFARGVTTSESEREIQVGNLAQYDAASFDPHFQYIALGHIHKPQKVSDKVFYSGSPVPLSFSEISDKKRMVVYEVTRHAVEARNIEVPVFRKLLKISGSLEEIRKALSRLEEPETDLPVLIEVEMQEPAEDPQKISELEELISTYDSAYARIVKHRVHFEDTVTGAHELYDANTQIEDLEPGDVLEKKMERTELDEEQRKLLREAFYEILESVYQSESS